MPENHGADIIPDDELDLIKLLQKLITFLRAYLRFILFCSIGGLILGFVMYSLQPRVYSSRLVFHSTLLNNKEQLAVMNGWNELLKRGEINVLARNFNCNPEILNRLVSFTVSEISKETTTDNQTGLILEVRVLDITILDSLQQGIIYGISNNDYIKTRIIQKTASLQGLIDRTKSEIRQLDSVKKILAVDISRKSPGGSPFILDVSNVNLVMVQLNERLAQYQTDLKFVSPVQVLQGFVKFSVPVSPKLGIFLALGLISGLVAGYFVSVILNLRKRLL